MPGCFLFRFAIVGLLLGGGLTISAQPIAAADPLTIDQARFLTTADSPPLSAPLLQNATEVSVRMVGLGIALRYPNQAQACIPIPQTFNRHTVHLTDQADSSRQHPLYTVGSTKVTAYQYGYVLLSVSIPGYELPAQTPHQLTVVGGADGVKFDCQGSEAPLASTFTTNFITGSDTFAPVIVEPSHAATLNNALVSWKNGEITTGKVDYGLTTGYGSTVTSPPGMDHQLAISNLQPGTTYHYRITSRDLNHNQSTKTGTFSTWSMGAITVSDITGHEASVRWTTSVPTDSIVEYGTGQASYSSRTGSKDTSTNHNVRLVNLRSQTTYYFRIKATTANGTAVTQQLRFATLDALAGASTEPIRFEPEVSAAFDEWNNFNLRDFPPDQLEQASSSSNQATQGAVLADKDSHTAAVNKIKQGIHSAEQRLGWWVVWIAIPVLLVAIIIAFYIFYRFDVRMNGLRLEIIRHQAKH